MKTTHTLLACIISLLIFSAFLSPPADCGKLRNGRFHIYGVENSYTIVRKDTLQIEINKKTGDTSWWRVKWISPCGYTLRFLAGQEKMESLKAEFYENSRIKVSIRKYTADYYIYDGQLSYKDMISNSSDTMWLKERNKWIKYD